jgi:hypothetical protein
MSDQSRISAASQSRIAQNRHRVGIEQAAARDLADARNAAAAGEQVEYVPLWRR